MVNRNHALSLLSITRNSFWLEINEFYNYISMIHRHKVPILECFQSLLGLQQLQYTYVANLESAKKD
jgi:hypothetical protein